MKTKLISGLAVVTAWAGTLKLCCVLPAALAVLGLTGTAASLVVRWLSPALTGMSLLFLGYSFYTLYVRRRGNRTGRITTWVSAVSVAGFWVYRLLLA